MEPLTPTDGNKVTPPAGLELPPGGSRGNLLWHDGERLAWLPAPTGEGQTLTSAADGGLVWANPAGLRAPKIKGRSK